MAPFVSTGDVFLRGPSDYIVLPISFSNLHAATRIDLVVAVHRFSAAYLCFIDGEIVFRRSSDSIPLLSPPLLQIHMFIHWPEGGGGGLLQAPHIVLFGVDSRASVKRLWN